MKKTTEDYLKLIRLLQKKNGAVHSIAISEAFGVSKPTVSRIVKRLVAEGYITMSADYAIDLTEKGLSLADETIERNRTIRDLLISLGVEKSIAETDACEMEHTISSQSLSAFKKLAKRNRSQS